MLEGPTARGSSPDVAGAPPPRPPSAEFRGPSIWETAYWHGGPAGLSVGEYLLPPSVTGTPHVLTAYSGRAELRPGVRRDRVYVSDRYEVAEVFAAMHPEAGCVYRVLPEGPLEEDPDGPGLSWACARARIISVHPLDEATELRILKAVLGGAS